MPDQPSSQRLVDLPKSFGYAGEGLRYLVRSQRNIRIHLILMALAIILALWLGLSAVEWSILLLTIGLVLSAEALNTAIEATVDQIGLDQRPLAKIAKDTAASAVLISALVALCVAAFLFLPRLSLP